MRQAGSVLVIRIHHPRQPYLGSRGPSLVSQPGLTWLPGCPFQFLTLVPCFAPTKAYNAGSDSDPGL